MKKIQKSYERPLRPWDKKRIEEERKLSKNYGLRRKKEILRAESILRNYRRQARDLAAQRDKEKETILLSKLKKLGLIQSTASLDDVLALGINDLLDRRLQTIIVRKGIARTQLQARQFIVHGHVALDGRRIRWPSALIPVDQEDKISFYKSSKVKINTLKKLEAKPEEKPAQEPKGEIIGAES